MTGDPRIADQLEQIELDLAELDDQVAAGELDDETADRLRATYRDEAERLEQIEPTPEAKGRSPWRIAAGAVVLGLGVTVIAAAAVASLSDRPPGGNLTGGVATDVISGEGVDLDSISDEQMEEVIAANPDIVPMRLALARRYFEAGEFSSALDHYLYVLQDLGRDEPEALANVGWMTYLSGQTELAAELVERALTVQPDFPQAHWFLANIEAALGDHCAALASLDRLRGFEDVPADVTAQADSLRATAEASCDG